MTVNELIEKLQRFPGDWPVCVPELSFEALPAIEASEVSQGWNYRRRCDAESVEIT